MHTNRISIQTHNEFPTTKHDNNNKKKTTHLLAEQNTYILPQIKKN